MPEGNPAPQATSRPIQQDVRFLVGYANVYSNIDTGALEIGARVYRSPEAADRRRQRNRVRGNLAFVGVVPISAVVATATANRARQAAIEARNSSGNESSFDDEGDGDDNA